MSTTDHDKEIQQKKSSYHYASSVGSFGCCSSYRACSDAKACLVPHSDYYENCSYRKNLEAGIIFYGKNAPEFDRELYENLIETYHQLTIPERETLQAILHYF